MKQVAGTLRLDLASYREKQAFAQFGSDLDADTVSRLAQGERIVEMLKQDKSHPVRIGCQIAVVYAAVNDKMRQVPVEKVRDYEKKLYIHMENNCPDLIKRLENGYYDDCDREQLGSAVDEFTREYIKENAGETER